MDFSSVESESVEYDSCGNGDDDCHDQEDVGYEEGSIDVSGLEVRNGCVRVVAEGSHEECVSKRTTKSGPVCFFNDL